MPVRYYRGPGCDPVRYYRGILGYRLGPRSPKSLLDAVLPVTRGQLSIVRSEILEHRRENTATVRRIRAFATASAGAKPNSPHNPAPGRAHWGPGPRRNAEYAPVINRAAPGSAESLADREAAGIPAPLPRRREHSKQTTFELKR